MKESYPMKPNNGKPKKRARRATKEEIEQRVEQVRALEWHLDLAKSI